MRCHCAGNFVQAREFRDPENLIAIQVAVKALRGAGVRGQKAQYCAVAEADIFTRQRHAEMVLGDLDDVFTEDFRLGAACREKDLVITGNDSIFECLPGEIIGHADLSAFQNEAPVFAFMFAAVQLVLEEMFPRPGVEHFRCNTGNVVFLIPTSTPPMESPRPSWLNGRSLTQDEYRTVIHRPFDH